jgi:hypothetical protein
MTRVTIRRCRSTRASAVRRTCRGRPVAPACRLPVVLQPPSDVQADAQHLAGAGPREPRGERGRVTAATGSNTLTSVPVPTLWVMWAGPAPRCGQVRRHDVADVDAVAGLRAVAEHQWPLLRQQQVAEPGEDARVAGGVRAPSICPSQLGGAPVAPHVDLVRLAEQALDLRDPSSPARAVEVRMSFGTPQPPNRGWVDRKRRPTARRSRWPQGRRNDVCPAGVAPSTWPPPRAVLDRPSTI